MNIRDNNRTLCHLIIQSLSALNHVQPRDLQQNKSWITRINKVHHHTSIVISSGSIKRREEKHPFSRQGLMGKILTNSIAIYSV